MRYVVVVLVLATLALLAALILTEAPPDNDSRAASAEAPGTLQIIDKKVGDGKEAKTGDQIRVHYTGTFKDGTKFDSSLDRNEPFSLQLGAGQVIQGWDQGIVGMKVGGIRKLIIPYNLAYGEQGRPGIPPKAELTFVVELLEVN
jgi:FKBP-type peptidyl-prolyl cis-trans isomerase